MIRRLIHRLAHLLRIPRLTWVTQGQLGCYAGPRCGWHTGAVVVDAEGWPDRRITG